MQGEASTRGPATGHLPALDGLRGVAIALIIAYHFALGWAHGGFLGVDAFLVLSGYFVTTMVLSKEEGGRRFDFAAFWTSRLRRLVPQLAVVTLAVAGWAYFLADRVRLSSIRLDALWAIVFGANWHFIANGQSYFDLYSAPSPFRHVWMLAVVVQFYVLWPPILVGCLRLTHRGRRAGAIVAAVGAAASFALLTLLHDAIDPSRAYYGTDTRAGELLIGALLAFALAGRKLRGRNGRAVIHTLGFVGMLTAAVLVGVAYDRDRWLYPAGFLAAALSVTAIMASVAHPGRSPVRAVLSLRPVVWVGEISYALYLWHWPVRVALTRSQIGVDGWELTAIRVAVTLAVAVPSYYLIERPIRRGRMISRRWMRTVAPAMLAATALIVVGATAGATTAPRFLTAPQGSVLHRTPPTTVAPSPSITSPVLTRWLLVGDSVAASLGDALQWEAARRGVTLSTATRPGCGLIGGITALPDGTEIPWGRKCDAQTRDYLSQSVSEANPQVVLWLSTWEAADRIVDGVFYAFGSEAADRKMLELLEEARATLTAGGARLVILTTPPPAAENELDLRDRDGERRTVHLNDLFREFGRAHPESVTVVDFDAVVCPPGPPCPARVDDVVPRPRDGNHFEGDGPLWVAPRLMDLATTSLGS